MRKVLHAARLSAAPARHTHNGVAANGLASVSGRIDESIDLLYSIIT